MLWNAVAGTARTRRRETALLRTLGASRRWVCRQLVRECALLGLLAGLLAALPASLVSAVLGRLILEEWLALPPPLLGATLSAAVGWLNLRAPSILPPALVLREAD